MSPASSKLSTRLAWLRFRGRERLRALQDRWHGRGPVHQQALLDVLTRTTPGDPEAALHALDRFAREERFLMNAADRKGRVLESLLDEHQPKRALELGAYLGYTALRMGIRLQRWGGQLDTVEAIPAHAAVTEALVSHTRLNETIRVHTGASAQILPTLSGRYDLVFFDHDKRAYLTDLQLLELTDALSPNAIVVADNVGIFAEPLRAYLDHVRQSERYTSGFHPTHLEYQPGIPDGMEVSVFRGEG